MNPIPITEVIFINVAITLACAAIIGGLGFLIALAVRAKRSVRYFAGFVPAGYTAFIVAILTTLGSIFFQHIPAQTAFHTPQGVVVAVFDEGTSLWRYGPFRDSIFTMEGEFLPFGEEEYMVAMRVSPITDNPKVREIRYSVGFIACGAEAGPKQCWEARKAAKIVSGEPTLKNLVRYHLYDMQDKGSRTLAALSNPLDGSQQEYFLKIVRDYLEEQLPDGIRVTSAVFSFL